MPFFFIKKINMVISSKTYNPDCDPVQDDTQKELDQLDRPAEPDATDAVLAEMEAMAGSLDGGQVKIVRYTERRTGMARKALDPSRA